MIDTVGPRCSICKKTGHNRRTCQVMEDGYHEVNYPLTRYEGEFKDGKYHGQGVFTWSDGARYEGEWKDGNRHGQGVYTDDDGRYEGEWKDCKFHGQGVMHTFADGRRYEGEFKDGKKYGQGVITFPDYNVSFFRKEYDMKVYSKMIDTMAKES